MDVIKDRLDGKVEESDYHNAMIQTLFNWLEKDDITPCKRYEIFEESNRREFMKKKEKQGCAKVAKNMWDEAFALEIITKLTDLAFAEIENLIDAEFNDE